MKTTTKRIWLAVTLVIALAVVVGLSRVKESPPQIITIPNGDQYRFAGVHYGTLHVQPTPGARLIKRVPASLTNLVQRVLGIRAEPITSFSTPEPSFVVWFDRVGTNTVGRSLYGMLADQDSNLGGKRENARYFNRGRWLAVPFPWVPRRSRDIECAIFTFKKTASQSSGQSLTTYPEVGRVRFRNPLFGKYPQWQPETLPVTKNAGDLEIQLIDFEIRVDRLREPRYLKPTAETRSEAIPVIHLKYNSPRGTNGMWAVQSFELSDPTGNRYYDPYDAYSPIGEYSIPMGPTPWPDEGAWRLKLEIKIYPFFYPYAPVTFKDVPIPTAGATNVVVQTNIIEGVPVIMRQEFWYESKSFPANNLPGRSFVTSIDLLAKQSDIVMNLADITTDTGLKVGALTKWIRGRSEVVSFQSIPTTATSLSFHWVVQKTRTVEFLVKPPKAE